MRKKLLLAGVAMALLMSLLWLPAPNVGAQTSACTACDAYSGLALCVREDTSLWARCRIVEACFMGGMICYDRCVFSSYCRRPI